MKKENPIVQKSTTFALDIIKAYQFLCTEKHEYVLSKQVLRSSTSIGANISEGVRGQSKADFLSKFSISLKEASETKYWLYLLYESGYLPKDYYEQLQEKCEELIKMLMAITKTTKNNT